MLPRGEPKNPAAFVKPSHRLSTPPVLTVDRIAANTARRVTTSFIPDTNIVIRIEKASDPELPATDATLRHFGLLEWVELMRACDKNRYLYSISPYWAFAEQPKSSSARCLSRYYAFWPRFGLHPIDDPHACDYPHLGREEAPSIWSHDLDRRHFLSISYCHLLLMLLVQRDCKHWEPLRKFQRFVCELINHVPLLSYKEIGAAKFVFANPNGMDEPLIQLCRAVRNNFGKHEKKMPITFEDIDAAALNGAIDLVFINFANVAETWLPTGEKLDNWVVTTDNKTVALLGVMQSFDPGGLGHGAAIKLDRHESPDGYFEAVEDEIEFLTASRPAYDRLELPVYGEMDAIIRRVQARVKEGIRAID